MKFTLFPNASLSNLKPAVWSPLAPIRDINLWTPKYHLFDINLNGAHLKNTRKKPLKMVKHNEFEANRLRWYNGQKCCPQRRSVEIFLTLVVQSWYGTHNGLHKANYKLLKRRGRIYPIIVSYIYIWTDETGCNYLCTASLVGPIWEPLLSIQSIKLPHPWIYMWPALINTRLI